MRSTSTSTHTIFHRLPDGSEIPVEICRKRVKNLNLRVRRDGSVALSIPQRCSETAAQRFLNERGAWLLRAIESQERRLLQQENAAIRAEDSASPDDIVPLWGKPVRAGELWDDATVASLTKGQLEKLTLELYRQQVKTVLPEISERYEQAMGKHAASWQVRSMKSRWGSCSTQKATIRISLQLAAYPPECLDMVVAHELVHLMEANHGPRFHMLLDCYCPNNRAIARRLRKPPLG